METELFWSGTFGNEYTQRCQIDPETRKDFWKSAIEYCTPEKVLEVGCNRGHNLIAIQMLAPDIDTYGVDVNGTAVNEARAQGVGAQLASAKSIANIFGSGSMDLVFTAGVLIHVAPDDLQEVMQAMVDTSARYVLAIEYMAEEETEVEYRGHAGKLWKRPFGKLFEGMGLTLLSTGVAGGFDQCEYVLLEKPGVPT